MELYQITPNDIKNNLINLHQIVFEVTNSCNFRCNYCIYSGMYKGFNQLSNHKLSFDKAKAILDYLINLWDENQRFVSSKPIFIGFYGGEPLLNISLIKQIVEYVEKNIMNKQKVIFSMTTNAFFIDKYMDYLVNKDFQLLISLDGNRETNINRKTKTNEESFPIVFDKIIKLKEKYPVYFEKRINFNAVFNQKSSFETLYDFFWTNFKKVPAISQVNNSNIIDTCQEDFNNIYKNKYQSFIHSSNKKEIDEKLFLSSPGVELLTNFLFYHTGNVYSTYNDLFFDIQKAGIIPTGTCVPFQKKLFITVSGKILQCEKISHEYTLGYTTEDSVSLDLEEIANNFNNQIKLFFDQCRRCALSYKCPICILQKYSKINEKEVSCKNFYTKKKYDKYVKNNMGYLKENPTLYERILKEVIHY